MHEVSPLLGRTPLGVETDLGFGAGDPDQDPAPTLEDQLETVPAIDLDDLVTVDFVPVLSEPPFVDLPRAFGERDLGASEGEDADPGGQLVGELGHALAFDRHHLGGEQAGEHAVPFGQVLATRPGPALSSPAYSRVPSTRSGPKFLKPTAVSIELETVVHEPPR